MYISLLEEGVLSLARCSLRNARETLANSDVVPEAKQTPVVARLAIPWVGCLIKRAGTRRLSVVISVAAAGPYLDSIPRHLRQTLFELGHADLTRLEEADDLLLAGGAG